ncbi:endolytic transglycosylase MltG [Pseudodesulfovibrio tunisiensis]|uniref:endolytic transglycosylase MltG n=1 Tax=Pseudodesulfovibrio tunisiensis TaxID=463192 RepID=UPI001FB456B9|nr:endolytic transglycosylase MltG [Pseudodesulfovibrio tunisiensis]
MARKRTLIIFTVVPVLLLLFSAGGYFGYKTWQEHRFLTVPPETPGHEAVFRVEPGQSLWTIARNLKKQGLVTDARRFVALATLRKDTGRVRAGQFRLHTGWIPDSILNELTTSPGIMQRVSVREGLTWWATAAVIEKAGIGTAETFEKAVFDRSLLDKYDIPANSAEGYLFPETYLLTPPTDDQARAMAETMIREFLKNARNLWPGGLPPAEELHRIVILASLVEKETGAAHERERIAGVFANRLKKRMLIQADPTIIYGLGPQFDGDIRKSHLQDRDNPYNTYTHPGLPPGPICSPGLESLRAAAFPEPHGYLYFVAKGDGTHHFSRTLMEHNKAVARYQLRRNRSTYRSTISE